MIRYRLTIDDIIRVHAISRENFAMVVGCEGIDRRRATTLIYGAPCSRKEIEKLLSAVNSFLPSGNRYTLDQIRWIEEVI